MKNESAREGAPDSIPAQKSSFSLLAPIGKPQHPRRTPEELHEWRIEKFGNDITVLLECDHRRKEAEARLPIRWGF